MAIETVEEQLLDIIKEGNYFQAEEILPVDQEIDPERLTYLEGLPQTYDHAHWKKIQEQRFYELQVAIKESLLIFVFIVGFQIFLFSSFGIAILTFGTLANLAIKRESSPIIISWYLGLFFFLELGYVMSELSGVRLIKNDDPFLSWDPDDPRNPAFEIDNND